MKFKASKLVNTSQAKQIFRFRTRMSNVKSNFKSQYIKEGLTCPLLGCSEMEDDQHLLKCNITSGYRVNSPVNFDKLSSGKVDEQLKIIELLVSAENIRDSLLEDQKLP